MERPARLHGGMCTEVVLYSRSSFWCEVSGIWRYESYTCLLNIIELDGLCQKQQQPEVPFCFIILKTRHTRLQLISKTLQTPHQNSLDVRIRRSTGKRENMYF